MNAKSTERATTTEWPSSTVTPRARDSRFGHRLIPAVLFANPRDLSADIGGHANMLQLR